MGLLFIGATGSIGTGVLPIISSVIAGIPFFVRGNIKQCVYLEKGVVTTFTLEEFLSGKHPLVQRALLRISYIIYLANPRFIPHSQTMMLSSYRVNFLDLARVINTIKKGSKDHTVNLLYASTGSVYSSSVSDLKRECDSVCADDTYQASKLLGEAICALESKFNRTRLRCTSLRIFHVFKDFQEKGFIYQLVSRISQGKPIILDGPSGKIITPTSVTLVAHSILDLLDYKGVLPAVINLCGSVRTSMRQLSSQISELCGLRLSGFEIIGKEEFFVGDNTLLRTLLTRETVERYFDMPLSLESSIYTTAILIKSKKDSR